MLCKILGISNTTPTPTLLTCRLHELNNIYWNKTYGGHFKCGIQPKEPNLIKMQKLNKLLENAKANPKESKPFQELAIFYSDHIHTSQEINLSKDLCIAEAGKNATLAMKLELTLMLRIIDFFKERQT